MSSDRVFEPAHAKINLCLHVGGKRTDGYHDLESLVVFAAHGDGIWLEHADGISISIAGPFGAGLTSGDDNLTIRAARTLAERVRTASGVRITLHKSIPVASGLGGGSADAAAVLRGLVRLWNLDLDRNDLREIAASIGADVPVCIDSAAAWMEGRGERIAPLPALPGIGLLLANPGVGVPTADVFAALRERRGLGLGRPTAAFEDARALVRFLHSTTNDLEAPARAVAPVIGEVLEEIARLPGVLLARMSGSGASCFGLFVDEHLAGAAAILLRQRRPNWWIETGGLVEASAAVPVAAQNR
jgi:4-diphosphocytidyl-2-C-methyl-D-erythritol kinase